MAFTLARFKASAEAAGASADIVDAVLAVSDSHVLDLHRKVQAIRAIAGTEDFLPIMHTFKRVLNITRDEKADLPTPADLADQPQEAQDLLHAVTNVEQSEAFASLHGEDPDYDAAIAEILTLHQPVATFFDEVLVAHENPAIRAKRMGLLLRVATVFLEVADFSRISTR